MLEGNEVDSIESDVSEGSSSEASDSSSINQAEPAKQASPAPETKQETTPFHEHPRFKELVEQKNHFSKQYQDMEARYKALESQLSSIRDSQPKPQSEMDQLVSDLKKIDPRLAAAIEKQLSVAQTTEALQKRLEQFEQQSKEQSRQQTLSTAISKINSLHESNKMSDFGKQFINNQLDIAYRSGNLDAANLKAVEEAYGESLKAIKAYEDSIKRTTTANYVQEKAKDSSVPTSVPKGSPAKAPKQDLKVPKSKDDLRAAVVKSYLKEQAANREATNN